MQSAIQIVLEKYKYFIPSKEISRLYICKEWEDCLNYLLKIKGFSETQSKRMKKMYEILNNLPRYSRCYPQIFCLDNKYAYGIFSVERTHETVRLCRAHLDYDAVDAFYYYVTVSDFYKVIPLLDYKVSLVEIEPIWGWGTYKYYESKIMIDNICSDDKYLRMESKTSKHNIHFDGNFTDGTFAIDRCSAMSKEL